jgi:hypothetical protein
MPVAIQDIALPPQRLPGYDASESLSAPGGISARAVDQPDQFLLLALVSFLHNHAPFAISVRSTALLAPVRSPTLTVEKACFHSARR